MKTIRVLVIFSLVAASSVSVRAQSVISTRAGVINFSEGAVYLNERPVEPQLGRFPMMSPGSELRTAEGRAEVLLTPGVFLRMDQHSSVRMVANNLADTEVEVQKGSVIIDSGDLGAGTSVTLIYKDWWIHILRKGTYRVDTDQARMRVNQGHAEVLAGADGVPVSVSAGEELQFSNILLPERAEVEIPDALSDWSNGRSQSIAADNAITEQIGDDGNSKTVDPDHFTNFPYLGVPILGLGSYGLGSYGAMSSIGMNQPGFNSIYFPGYRFAPLVLGSWGYRVPFGIPSRPVMMPVRPGSTIGPSHLPAPHPAPIHAPARGGVRPL